MQLRKCLLCDRLPAGKMASAYYGWHDAANVRKSFLAKYCVPCLEVACLTPDKGIPQVDGYLQVPTHCFHCAAPLAGDSLEVTYVTVYGPDGRYDLALGWCDPCTDMLRASIVLQAQELDDRGARPTVKGAGRGATKR